MNKNKILQLCEDLAFFAKDWEVMNRDNWETLKQIKRLNEQLTEVITESEVRRAIARFNLEQVSNK